jgi:hypothetical protein
MSAIGSRVEHSFFGNTKHFDPATQHDEDAVMHISPLLRIPLPAESCQPSDLTGVKLGKP